MRQATHWMRAPLVAATTVALLATACVEVGIPASGNKPHAELNPLQDVLHHSPAFKDQEPQRRYDGERGEWVESGMRATPSQAVSQEYRSYPHPTDPEQSKALLNPVAITADSLRYGKLLYETNCVVCHGTTGQGDGYVIGTGKYEQKPPSLTSVRARNWEDGEIYHVITNGQGSMWSYKNQLYPVERWAVVNYVRAMQRADYPEPQDLERVSE